MIVSIQRVYVFFTLFLILILYSVNRIEVNVLVFTVGVLCFRLTKKSLYILKIVSPLFLIFCLGIFSSLFSRLAVYDIFKDTVYFLKPITAIVFGYLLFGLIETKRAYRVLIIIGLIFAVIHIYNVLTISNLFSISIHSIRGVAGLNNFIEMISILILLILKKNNIYVFSKLKSKVIFWILIVSFILYFSRTMLFALIIMYLFAMGYHRLNKRGIIIVCTVILLIILFYWYLFSIDLSIEATGIEAFLYKMRMAPGELFFNADTINVEKITYNDLRYLYDHWRGFEASRALNQMTGIEYVFGGGFGSLVDLGFETLLGGELIQYIPILHNGYIYVLFKVGFIGLLLYFLFYFILFSKFNKKFKNNELNFITSLALAIITFFILSSLVITGIYNQGDLITFLLGGVLCLQRRAFINTNLKDENTN